MSFRRRNSSPFIKVGDHHPLTDLSSPNDDESQMKPRPHRANSIPPSTSKRMHESSRRHSLNHNRRKTILDALESQNEETIADLKEMLFRAYAELDSTKKICEQSIGAKATLEKELVNATETIASQRREIERLEYISAKNINQLQSVIDDQGMELENVILQRNELLNKMNMLRVEVPAPKSTQSVSDNDRRSPFTLPVGRSKSITESFRDMMSSLGTTGTPTDTCSTSFSRRNTDDTIIVTPTDLLWDNEDDHCTLVNERSHAA